MDDYTIDFLKLVKDKTTFLYEDNDNDKENKPSEELEKKIAEAVAMIVNFGIKLTKQLIIGIKIKNFWRLNNGVTTWNGDHIL